MRYLFRHLSHYLPLTGILLAGVLGFIWFSYDRTFQLAVAIATAVAYVVWALVHHHIHRDLHLAVVIEYIAIASLGVVILFTLIFRA